MSLFDKNKKEEPKIKDVDFLLYDDKDYTTHFYKQGFFSDKEVEEESFYCAVRDFKEENNGTYYYFPRIVNCDGTTIDRIKFLKNKSVLSRKNNWKSDFGKRVNIINASYIEDENYQEMVEGWKFGLPIKLEFDVIYEDSKEPVFEGNKKSTIVVRFDILNTYFSAELLGMLLQNAMNGNLQTIRDIDKYYRLEARDKYGDEEAIYQCETCKEYFFSLEAYFNHLLTHAHFDDILNWFPNDREVLHVKNIVQKKQKESLEKAKEWINNNS